MRSTLRKKVSVWTALVLSSSVIFTTQADRGTGQGQQDPFMLKRGPASAQTESGILTENAIKLKRDEHLVGKLPWTAGQDPIKSYAGHIPIRSWHQANFRGETSM